MKADQAKALRTEGATFREIGVILGVSTVRAWHLVKTHSPRRINLLIRSIHRLDHQPALSGVRKDLIEVLKTLDPTPEEMERTR